jgi:transcriptional regulator with XRE-family HTH domain
VQLDRAIGETLKTFRKNAGMTQKELAYITGLDLMTISRIERGIRAPSMISFFLITKALSAYPHVFMKAIEQLQPIIQLQEEKGGYSKMIRKRG